MPISVPVISEDKTKGKEDTLKRVKRRLPPDIADQKELITLLKNDNKIGFLYMIYAVSWASEFYTPYCLTYVN